MKVFLFDFVRPMQDTLRPVRIVDRVSCMSGMASPYFSPAMIDSFSSGKTLSIPAFPVRKGRLISLAACRNRAMYTLVTRHVEMLFYLEDAA